MSDGSQQAPVITKVIFNCEGFACAATTLGSSQGGGRAPDFIKGCYSSGAGSTGENQFLLCGRFEQNFLRVFSAVKNDFISVWYNPFGNDQGGLSWNIYVGDTRTPTWTGASGSGQFTMTVAKDGNLSFEQN